MLSFSPQIINRNLHVTILINKVAIEEVQYVKYLDVLIDSKLTFKYHIDELNRKVSRAIGVLYKLRLFVTSKIIANVYYAIIYPFLLYEIAVLGNVGKTLLTYCKKHLSIWQHTTIVPLSLDHLPIHLHSFLSLKYLTSLIFINCN